MSENVMKPVTERASVALAVLRRTGWQRGSVGSPGHPRCLYGALTQLSVTGTYRRAELEDIDAAVVAVADMICREHPDWVAARPPWTWEQGNASRRRLIEMWNDATDREQSQVERILEKVIASDDLYVVAELESEDR